MKWFWLLIACLSGWGLSTAIGLEAALGVIALIVSFNELKSELKDDP